MTVVESVYSVGRTDFLYKADYVSSLKGYHPTRDAYAPFTGAESS
jgi:hypothetical protein